MTLIEIIGVISSVLGIVGFFLAYWARVQKKVSIAFDRLFKDWIRGESRKRYNTFYYYNHFFQSVFGQKILSRKFIVSSFVVGILTSIIFRLIIDVSLSKSSTSLLIGGQSMGNYFITGTFYSILIPGFLSMAETTILLRVVAKTERYLRVMLLAFDLVLTTIIALFAIYLEQRFNLIAEIKNQYGDLPFFTDPSSYSYSNIVWTRFIDTITFNTKEGMQSGQWVFSIYFTSLWLYCFLFSSFVLKNINKKQNLAFVRIQQLINRKPYIAIGVVSSAFMLLFIFTFWMLFSVTT